MGWRDEGRERVKNQSEGTFMKLVSGSEPNCVRVLPDKRDLTPDGRLGPKGVQHSPVREFRMHYKVGPDEAAVGCGKDIDGNGRCYLCDDVIPKLEASQNPKHRERADKIKASDQFMVQATRFDPETQKFGPPKPLKLSTGGGGSLAVRVHSKLVSSRKDHLDPVKGYNLNIEKTGEGMKTRYPAVESDESPTKVPLTVTAACVSLDSLVPKYDEAEMKSAYLGRPKEDVDDEPLPEDTEDVPDEPLDDVKDAPYAEDEEAVEDADAEELPDEEAAEEDPDVPEEYGESEPEEEPEPEPAPRRPAKQLARTAPSPARRTAPPPPARPPARPALVTAKRPAAPPPRKPAGRR